MMYIYCYFNSLGGFFVAPYMDKVEPEQYKKDFYMGLYGLKDEHLETLKDCDLYYLGTFDNETGEIKYSKEFMLHVSEVVASVLKKREVINDVGNKEA